MGEYASRGSTYAGPVSARAGYSPPQPAQTPVDRARDLASSAKRQLTLVEAAITELTAAHEANNLPRWKHARARLDVALAQADRRLDQLRSRASNEAETIAALESATRDLAAETERAHVAEPPKGYVVVEHEDALLASLRADATLDSVRTLLDELAIADLRVLRARIASPHRRMLSQARSGGSVRNVARRSPTSFTTSIGARLASGSHVLTWRLPRPRSKRSTPN